MKLSDLKPADIGRWVQWTDPNWRVYPNRGKDLGRIKSWSKQFLHVVFNCNENWPSFELYTAEAVEAEQCKFVFANDAIGFGERVNTIDRELESSSR